MAGSSRERTFESIETLDATLSRVARSAGSLRLGLGTALERLARTGGHHELGFASVEAYALERCERSARWVQTSRALARRLENLPAVRRAVASGRVSFCMAQVIADVATPEDENIWLAGAATRTVRQMRALMNRARVAAGDGIPVARSEEPRRTLSVTVDHEDAWLFECARTIVRHVAGGTLEETLEALLGEGTTALLPVVPREHALPFDGWHEDEERQRAWEAQLAAWRDEAEARCEPRLAASRDQAEGVDTGADADFSDDPAVLDTALRRLAAELARKDLTIGKVAEAFWKADGWRRLGYATESQYARERLGCSLSSIKAKRTLARRVGALPQLAGAMERREIGYEAARLVTVVAAPETEGAWVARARARTVRHLRDEIDAAQMLGRLAGRRSMLPPSDDLMKQLATVESRIVSGEAVRENRPAGQMFAALIDLASLANEPPSTRDRIATRGGRVTLRFRAGVGLVRYHRSLEELFQRHRPAPMSFFRFLCTSFIDSWKETLSTNVEYGHVYERDRFRCTSPVCTRRDVTPHHLRFRAHGGDDSDENVASLCTWCHLEGVHGGRLRATPPASDVEWTIGRTRHTVVRGRARAA